MPPTGVHGTAGPCHQESHTAPTGQTHSDSTTRGQAKGPPKTRLLYQVFALLAHVVRSPPVAVALVQACESSHLPDSRQIPAYAGEGIRCGTTPSIKAVGSSRHEIRLARFRAQVCRQSVAQSPQRWIGPFHFTTRLNGPGGTTVPGPA